MGKRNITVGGAVLGLIAGLLPFGLAAQVEAAPPTPTGELLLLHRTEFATGFADMLTSFRDTAKVVLDGAGTDVPLIGSGIESVAQRVDAPFTGISTDVRNTVEDALFNAAANGDDPLEIARGALYVTLGPGPSGLSDLDPAIEASLTPLLPVIGNGLEVLADRDGDLSITPDDIGITTTLDALGQPEIAFEVDLADTFTMSVPFDVGLAFDPAAIAPDLGPFVDVLGDGSLDVASSVQVDAGWTADLDFGVSTADGFYIPERQDAVFSLGVFGTTPNLDIDTTIGMFGVNLKDGTTENGITENSRVQIASTWKQVPAVGAPTDNRMLAQRLVAVGTDKSARVRLAVTPRADLPTASVGGIPITLPEISFELEAEANRNGEKFQVTSVRFDEMTLNVRKMLDGLGRQFGTFAERGLGPIANMGDALDSRIPGISDMLGERVTIAQALPSEADDFFDEVSRLGNLSGLFQQAASAAPSSFNFGCVDVINVIPGQRFGPCVGKGQQLQYTSVIENGGVVQIEAFKLINVVKMLAGVRTDLMSVGLPVVDVNGEAKYGFGISRLSFDVKSSVDVDSNLRLFMDSTGLEKALALLRAGQSPDPRVLLDGIYVKNNPTGYEFGVKASFSGGSSYRAKKWGVEVFYASANVDVNTGLGFELVDPDENGRLTYNEMSAISSGFTRPQNLLCLFDFEHTFNADVSGSVRVVGVGSSLDLGFPASDIKLQDLMSGVSGCPGIIAAVTNGTQVLATPVRVNGDNWLRLNVGAYSAERRFGNTDDSAGAYVSARMAGDDIIVNFRGVEQRFTGPFAGVTGLGDAGNDTFQLGAITLPVSVDGGAGNDTIVSGSGDDTLNGGLGNDGITSAGGNDVVRGGDGDDRIFGQAGDDELDGGRGNDELDGAGGNDRLRGGDGNDVLRAGTGDDQATGGAGDDSIDGAAGDDNLNGGPGNDGVNAGDGDDIASGGDGNDTVNGGLGTDRLDGGPGNDNIDGGASDDLLSGGAGNDRVVGGDGADVVQGGDGADALFGGSGVDELLGGIGDDTGDAGDGDDTVISGPGNDNFSGGAGHDLMHGGAGRDVLNGNDGDDTILGHQDDDTIDGGNDNDTIFGAEGDDTIDGGDGDDVIEGNDGDNTVNGQSGNDVITTNDGADTVTGGSGNDVITTNGGIDTINGNEDDDVIDAGDGDDDIIGGSGNDVLTGGQGRDRIVGEDGDDTINAGTENDRVFGGAGNDRITAGSGDDDVSGSIGDDVLLGGPGNDDIDAGPGNDIVDGAAGDDELVGGSGDDNLTGGADDDEIAGNTGVDELIGNTGTDLLTGDTDDTWLDAGGDTGDRIMIDNLTTSALDERHVGQNTIWGLGQENTVFLGVERLEMRLDDDDNIVVDDPSLPVDIASFGASVGVWRTDHPLDITGSLFSTSDQLHVIDLRFANGATVQVEPGRITGLSAAPITHTGLDAIRLEGTTEADDFTVVGTDVATVIEGDSGDDTVHLTLPSVISSLVVDGERGADTVDLVIAGDPANVAGLANVGFIAVEDLRVDNGAGTVATDWKFTDGAVAAASNPLIATVAGVQTVTYRAGSAAGDDLDVTNTSPVPQTVTVGGDGVQIVEGADLFRFEEFFPSDGVQLTKPGNSSALVSAGPDAGGTFTGDMPSYTNPASQSGWGDVSVTPTGVADLTGFGQSINWGQSGTLIVPDLPQTGNNVSTPNGQPFLRADLVAQSFEYTVTADTTNDTVIARYPDDRTFPYDPVRASRGEADGVIPQLPGEQVDAIATDGGWIFVGDAARSEVRSYTFDGRQVTTSDVINEFDPNDAAARPGDTVSWGGPWTNDNPAAGSFSSDASFWMDSGAVLTRALDVPANALPVTELFFRTFPDRDPTDGRYDVYLRPVGSSSFELVGSVSRNDGLTSNSLVVVTPANPFVADAVQVRFTQNFPASPTFGRTTNISSFVVNYGTGGANHRSTITSTDPSFGQTLAAQGGVLVVGAPDNGAGGAISTYTYAGGDDWALQATNAGRTGDGAFGSAIDVLNGRVIVGDPSHDDGSGAVGRAEILTAPGLSPLADWTSPTGVDGDRFGAAVALGTSGDAVVGAPGTDKILADEGTAYIAPQTTNWSQLVELPTGHAQAGAACGAAVVLAGFSTVVVGCPDEDTTANGIDSGVVRQFLLGSAGAEAVAAATDDELIGGNDQVFIARPAFGVVSRAGARGGSPASMAIPGLEAFAGRDLLDAANDQFVVGAGSVVTTGRIPNGGTPTSTSFTLPAPIAAVEMDPNGLRIHVVTTDGTLTWFDADLNQLGSVPTGVTGPLVAKVNRGLLFVGGADGVAVLTDPAGTPTPMTVVANGSRGARGIAEVRGVAYDGTYLYVASSTGDSLTVLERDGTEFVFRQILNNLANGVRGLNEPVDIHVELNLSTIVYVGSVGSTALDRGISKFQTFSAPPPANRYDVRFDDAVERVDVVSGGKADDVRIRDIGRPLTVDTGDGADQVDAVILAPSQTFGLSTGDDADVITLRGTGLNGDIDVDSGADDDEVTLRAAAAGADTDIDLGTGDDTVSVYGDHLDSTPTISPSADPGDTLIFYSSVSPTIPAVPTPDTGSIQHPSHEPVDYVGIENFELRAPPVAELAAELIAEGGSVTFDTSGSFLPVGRTGTYSWDINGDGSFTDATGTAPSLTWAELQVLGIDDDGLYPVTVRITTDLGDADERTAALTITNVAPTISFALAFPAFPIEEGVGAVFDIDITDPGNDSIEQINIDWGDGTTETIWSDVTRVSHVYAQDGLDIDRNFTVRVTSIVDEDGTYPQTIAIPITVVNTTPASLAISGPAGIDEGDAYTLMMTPSDSLNIFVYRVDWGDGTVEDVMPTFSGPTEVATHVFDGPITSTISVVAVGYNGATPASNTVVVAVAGVDPTLTLAGPTTSPEGPYALALSATDPGDDTVTHWDIDWGDGSAVTTVVGAAPTVTHDFDGPATPTITATAYDEDGATSETRNVTINNVAPVIDSATIGTPVVEGTSTTVAVTATDADQLTYELRDAGGAVLSQNQSGNFTASVADDGPFSFTVVVTDDDGAATSSNITGTATNAVPTVDISALTEAAEGDVATASIAVADLGDDTATSAVVDWGSGPETVTLVAGAGTSTHVYADGPSTEAFTVVSVTDEDATHPIGATATIEVADVEPVFEIIADDYVAAGDAFALATTPITDPGADTIVSVDVDWGDGTNSALTVDGLNVATGSHAYADTVDTATIAVTVTNDDGAAAPVTHVVDVGRAPVADDETITIAEDTQTEVAVVIGDTDADDDLIAESVIVTKRPDFGAAFAEDGIVTYIPGTNFEGIDTLDYRVCDAQGLCDTATVDVTVTPETDAPELEDDVATLTESASIVVDVLDNDNDPDVAPAATPGDPTNTLTISAVDTGTTGLAATIVAGGVDIDTDGNFEALAAGATETRTVTYDVTSPGGTTTADIVVTLTGENDAPVAMADERTVGQNQEVDIAVLGNDTDVDTGDTVSVVSMAATTAPFTLSGDIITFTATGSYTSLPDGATAVESVVYTIQDAAGARSTATLTVTVTGGNEAPVAVPDTRTIDQNSSVDVPVLGNDTDVDAGDVLSVVGIDGTTAPFSLSGDTVTFDASGSYDDLAAGQSASESVGYTIEDTLGTQAASTVTITINGLNDAPSATPDVRTVGQNDEITVPVLGNDTDVDTGDTLRVVSMAPTTAPFVLSGDLITFTARGSYSSLGAGDTAVESVEYTIEDAAGVRSTATFTVTVNGVGDAPAAMPDAETLDEDESVAVAVLGNDTDVDAGDTLRVVSMASSTAPFTLSGDLVSFDAAGSYDGLAAGQSTVESVEYTIEDSAGLRSSATLTVTVIGLNDAPVANADVVTIDQDGDASVMVLGNDTDVDAGDSLRVVSMASTAAPFTLSGDVITFTTADSYISLGVGETAVESVEYTIEDGAGVQSTATFTVTVNGADDAPVVADGGGTDLSFTVDEDETLTFEPTDLITDPDLEAVTMTAFDATSAAGGTVVEGSLIYTPPADFNGADSFTFVMQGAGGTSTTFTATIDVAPQPDAPRVLIDGAVATSGTTDLAFGANLPALVIFDPDEDDWTAEVVSGTLPGGVTLGNDGVFVGSATTAGTTTATIEVCDATDLCTTFTLEVTTSAEPTVEPPPPVEPPTTGLPATGSSPARVIVWGAALALLGMFLVVATRRRQRSEFGSAG